MPQVAARLRNRAHEDWFELLVIGLSDEVGEVEIIWNKRADSTNSIAPLGQNEFFEHDDLARIPCEVSTIDQLVMDGRRPPHFLKIDVEGHEAAVLRGARRLLAGAHAPMVVQFEYGHTWIGGGEVLYHTQMALEEAGYQVGRLFPDHVAFKKFDWQDEHFRMGNYIAAKDPNLIKILS